MTESSAATSQEDTFQGLVVVGMDASAQGRQALRYAADIAKQRAWKLEVVHCWNAIYPMTPFGVMPPDTSKIIHDSALEVLNKVVSEELGDAPGPNVSKKLIEGSPATILVEESEKADLLVVGSRGHGGFASLALGSVSSACVHHAGCPVLVVRPRAHAKAA
jgi:nucleotide-binding universal stress UspA family protein